MLLTWKIWQIKLCTDDVAEGPKQFTFCDGSDTKHNEETGDNMGPLIIKKKDAYMDTFDAVDQLVWMFPNSLTRMTTTSV